MVREGFWVALDLAILGFLSERPRSGYDLKRRCFEGALRTFWTADQAQIYRTLDRLRAEGLAKSRRRRQAARPDRHVFELTDRGRQALSERAGDLTPSPALRNAFLVQLYFSADLPDDQLVALLRTHREECQVRLDGVRASSAELAADKALTARAAVLKQTALDGAAAGYRASIDWLDDCIQAVEDGVLPGSESGSGQRHLFGA
jgi:PadR family transcriptional regulator, regulatory protein AphA